MSVQTLTYICVYIYIYLVRVYIMNFVVVLTYICIRLLSVLEAMFVCSQFFSYVSWGSPECVTFEALTTGMCENYSVTVKIISPSLSLTTVDHLCILLLLAKNYIHMSIHYFFFVAI